MRDSDRRELEENARLIELLKEYLSGDYETVSRRAKQLREVFLQGVATIVEPKLNWHLDRLPQESLEEKRDLATWVNSELRQLGLAIRCPKTGHPAVLFADFKGASQGDTTRFRLQSSDERGRPVRTNLVGNIPSLELMGEPPRHEPFARKRSSDRSP